MGLDSGNRDENTKENDRCKSRKRSIISSGKINRKKHVRKRSIIVLAVILAAASITGVLLIIRCCSGYTSTDDHDIGTSIKGEYVYDQYTEYSFDGNGRGQMNLETKNYDFSYITGNNILSIDFDDDTILDCEYSYSVDGDILTIIGGEGTNGYSYILTKKK